VSGSPFLFGKLPTHGDFVSRGLEPGTERVWDDWASAEMEAARERLDEGFEAAHDASPPWGFVSGPGPLGEGWRWGAIAASIDSAGRRFLIVAGQDGLDQAQAAFAGLTGALAAEGAIRRILVDGLDADAALAVIAEPAASPEALAAAAALNATAAEGVWWAFGDIVPPVASNTPVAGFVAGALDRVAVLLKEAA
jgi:type VI secretion system ImpM family protein